MRLCFVLALGATGLAPLAAQAAADPGTWSRLAAQSQAMLATASPEAHELPPPPAGVTDLRFAEFFRPIGDRGLEYSGKLRALVGRRVRLAGYMVRDAVHAPGLFLFAGWPVVIERSLICTQDDVPPTAVHVRVPTDRPLPFRPGRLVLIGTLELGSRPEADGRNSAVRLVLDAPATVALFGDAVAVSVPRAPAAAP